MSSLRDKTISGIFWSLLQKVGSRGITFIVTIILARILMPKDFGLIGMLSIFIAISETLIQAGFRQALIQREETNDEDYSSVFFINLFISVILYGVLFFSAPYIADFYKQPILIPLSRALGTIFIINAFSYVQEARLAKAMQFKSLMFINLPSTLISGIVAVIMAISGYGVWSIVVQQIVMRLAFAIQIWIHSKWKPKLVFNKKRAKGLFSFGSKLMIAGIISSIYENIYLITIGKFFSVSVLGYYQNAKKLVDVPTRTLSGVLNNVTFTAFSSIQNDNKKLKEGYRKIIQQMLFWLSPALVFSAVLAEPLFSLLLTDKWLPAAPFFKLLCIAGIFFPLNSYNLNIITVKGRSEIFLRLEIIKKIIITIGIVVTVPFGIWPLVIFQSVNAVGAYFLNSYYSGRFIQYSIGEQLKDILPILLLSAGVGSLILLIDLSLLAFPDIVRLILGFGIGTGIYWTIARLMKLAPYVEFKDLFQRKIIKAFR